jgi:hypothetical protein
MKTPLSRLLIATGLALALLPASTALAQGQTDLPVGRAHGVRIVNDRGGFVLIFSHRSAKLRQRINSRYAWISCTHLGDPFTSVGSGNLDIPRHGRRVRTGFSVEDADFCSFFLRSHTVKHRHTSHRVSRRTLFSIPLTQAGAVYLDEESKAGNLFTIGLLASLVKHDQKLPGNPSYAQLVQAYPTLAKVVVQLSAAGDTPPPKRIGYYSDGQEHVALAILSASGKRLFIEESAGNVLSTNVSAYLFGDRD